MQLSSILCALNLLHFLEISAHPTLNPKSLVKREIEDGAVDNRFHLLHKRMEGSSRDAQNAENAYYGIKSQYEGLKSMRKELEDVKKTMQQSESDSHTHAVNMLIYSSNIDNVEGKYSKSKSGEGSSRK
ncbi:hypothetical protein PGT21_029708 [Puccinia graminis f. sp. tritici]|uniref:Uncharacterized protein n=1 Tax=Puccinia graminis f. sp. tritici TaxID=56615 RepID=A0A5B0MDB2_PUCGR|nr:hypothetical protein PGT21_029708 [Puccinia graminis f. sp. tritici]